MPRPAAQAAAAHQGQVLAERRERAVDARRTGLNSPFDAPIGIGTGIGVDDSGAVSTARTTDASGAISSGNVSIAGPGSGGRTIFDKLASTPLWRRMAQACMMRAVRSCGAR